MASDSDSQHAAPSATQPVLSAEEVQAYKENAKRRGVVYLSRIPPYMKPEKVRALLSKHGELDRIYLVPEDAAVRKRRVKAGGNKKVNYVEGWVEFLNKKVAKRVALMLNNTPVGGKKHGFYHDDLWNVKYLPKVKWDHLTEKITHEKRVRELKLRAEITEAKKESAEYMERVEKAREADKIAERKRLKRQREEQADGGGAKAAPPKAPVVAAAAATTTKRKAKKARTETA